MGRSKQTSIGRAGEYLVAHLLELAGIEVYRVDGDCDLIVSMDGTLLRVEVKAASAINRRGFYRFNMKTRPDADYCAFVALDLALLRMFKTSDLGSADTKTINPKYFTSANQIADINRLTDSLVKRKKRDNM